jgi:putative addiction module component (TIGR02574 family)
MTQDAQELLERALKLSLKERAKLVTRLIESVDEEEGEDPVEVKKAWAEEIKRRVREIDEGRVKGISHEDVMKRFRQKFGQTKARRKR